jgi:hypothetical protein
MATDLTDEQERQAFEAWSRNKPGGGFTLDRYKDPQCTEYVHYNTQWAWEAWLARATLAKATPAPSSRISGDGPSTPTAAMLRAGEKAWGDCYGRCCDAPYQDVVRAVITAALAAGVPCTMPEGEARNAEDRDLIAMQQSLIDRYVTIGLDALEDAARLIAHLGGNPKKQQRAISQLKTAAINKGHRGQDCEVLYERRQREYGQSNGWGEWMRCTMKEAAHVAEMSNWQFRVLRVSPAHLGDCEGNGQGDEPTRRFTGVGHLEQTGYIPTGSAAEREAIPKGNRCQDGEGEKP